MRRRRGYILPMTLALVAIAAIVLARVCRQDMRRSLDVARDADELQRRWGMLSCQLCYLRQVEGVLESAETAIGRPAPVARAQVQLGGQRFELLFADESAKLNINAVYRHADAAAAQHVARVGAARSRPPLTVYLRPMNRNVKASDDEETPAAFGSFGQIFDEAGGASAISIQSASQDITCWGSGKLNWRRASAASLAQALRGDRQAAARIIGLQKLGKAATAQSLEQALEATPDGKKRAEQLFTETSDAQSLWIISDDVKNPTARFAIRQLRPDGHAKITSFTWQP